MAFALKRKVLKIVKEKIINTCSRGHYDFLFVSTKCNIKNKFKNTTLYVFINER